MDRIKKVQVDLSANKVPTLTLKCTFKCHIPLGEQNKQTRFSVRFKLKIYAFTSCKKWWIKKKKQEPRHRRAQERILREIYHETVWLSWIKDWNLPTGTAEHLLLFFITTTPREQKHISIQGKVRVTQSACKMFPLNTNTRWLQSWEETSRSRRNRGFKDKNHKKPDVTGVSRGRDVFWCLLLLEEKKPWLRLIL